MLFVVFPPGLHQPGPCDQPPVSLRATPVPPHQHRHCPPGRPSPLGIAMPGKLARPHDCQQADTSAAQIGPEQRARSWFAARADCVPVRRHADRARCAAGPRSAHLPGFELGCLTNGSAALTSSFVERAGLGPYIERVISVQEAGTWKPAAVVYRHAASVLGVEPGGLALVAAHAWDCHGASRAGLVTGWVSRLEREYSPIFAPPDVTGADLTEVAHGLLGLPDG